MASRLKLFLGAAGVAALTASASWLTLLLLPATAHAQALAAVDPDVVRWGLLAAAIATGASSLAAGLAVASVGAAAVGAVAEKPELFGRTLVLVGLAEGIAIYGLIVSILILDRLG